MGGMCDRHEDRAARRSPSGRGGHPGRTNTPLIDMSGSDASLSAGDEGPVNGAVHAELELVALLSAVSGDGPADSDEESVDKGKHD